MADGNGFSTQADNVERTVYVSNIGPQCTLKKITEFFGFCGKIASLRLRTASPGPSQEALVEFENPLAAKTSLMLKDALIDGVPIQVVPAIERVPPQLESQEEVKSANLEGQLYQNDAEGTSRTSTSVVASMLAAGYTLGQDSFQKAVALDEQHSISAKAQEAWNSVTTTATNIDEQYNISSTTMNFWNQATATITPYVVSAGETAKPYLESANEAAKPYVEAASASVSSATSSAMENPNVRSAVDTVNTSVVNLQESATLAARDLEEQTKQKIDEENKRRQEASGESWEGEGGERVVIVEEDKVIVEEDKVIVEDQEVL
eukprot:CAMPEP_0201475758 /NCGR_PEP_ID=MMETSP0151_2-20130828/1125_1 /ASSEMBLY_ACC=CAM_ASM_000257 /TAXON_ID=200890 /ORGANISM="Paramoeba atlantica, Strain 621/1 / CCAP 1560/9" /LENGTH=319 /DNA_ID=CAMNT_0047855941 /DNA_START=45 /DNA_END=1004 /DNA_ORIENTATION=+